MKKDSLVLERQSKKYSKKCSVSDPIFFKRIHFDGHNEDIVQAYYWHLNFAYFKGRKFTMLKLEDCHYFSESSQFGAQMRQVKGGTIRAFQENLTQLVQLIKVHLMPLLKEVKQAEFYNNWFKQIVENDDLIQQELKKPAKDRNLTSLKKWRRSRDEAINHIKDKWVNEVDGGRLWQINRPSSEQGLDFALLPQLFFGVNLERPLDLDSLTEQLDGDIYSIDISNLAKEQVARFLYKFHTWLPTAIKESTVAYRLKVSSLKQFYSQIQMYISFMKPLLIEISRKSESLESSNFYSGFDMDNPLFVNLFDHSYWYVKLLHVRNLDSGGFTLNDLEFTRFGLYVRKKSGIPVIGFGPHKGKAGFLCGEEVIDGKTKYMFIPYDGDINQLTTEKFNKMKDDWLKEKVLIPKEDLTAFATLEFNFSQKRGDEIIKTPQGPQKLPYMQNRIDYKAYSWNFYEIASYRESRKAEDLELLETFIDEIRVIKDDLMKYVNDLEGIDPLEIYSKGNDSSSSKNNSKAEPFTDIVFAPIKGLGAVFSPLIPNIGGGYKKKKQTETIDKDRDTHHIFIKISTLEDAWKGYSIFKKAYGFIQY